VRIALTFAVLFWLTPPPAPGVEGIEPIDFIAELGPILGIQREALEFSPLEGNSRHCRVRDPRVTLQFTGQWNVAFEARCEKPNRFRDCNCQAQFSARAREETRFQSSDRRFSIPHSPGWIEVRFYGSGPEVRAAYGTVEQVVLRLQDTGL